jgi:hypothetical protein
LHLQVQVVWRKKTLQWNFVDYIVKEIKVTKEKGENPIYIKRTINPNLRPKLQIKVIKLFLHKSGLLQNTESQYHKDLRLKHLQIMSSHINQLMYIESNA